MASTADFRQTRFELHAIQQGPNGLRVQCSERGVVGSAPPPLDLIEVVHLDAATVAKLVEAWTLLEQAFEPVYQAWAGEPARAHELVAAAVKAQADLASAQAQQAQLDADIAAKQAQLVALEAAATTLEAAPVTEPQP